MTAILKEAGALRIASYNVQKCVGTDLRRDPGRILDVLNSLDADVVALQEADRRRAPRPAALPSRMIESGSDFRAVDIGVGDSLGWHGNAILVHRDHAITSYRKLDLPGLEPRGAVLADIAVGKGGFRLAATHLGLARRHRQHQLRAIRAALAADDMPVAIAGDFNEWSETKGLAPLAGAFTVVAPGRSFHATLPLAALDRVAHSAALELRDAGVLATPMARSASDHLPVWADFRLPAAAAAC